MHLRSKLRNSLIGFLLGSSSASFIRIIYYFFSISFIILLSWGDQSCMQQHKMQAHRIFIWQSSDFFFFSSIQVFSPSKQIEASEKTGRNGRWQYNETTAEILVSESVNCKAR